MTALSLLHVTEGINLIKIILSVFIDFQQSISGLINDKNLMMKSLNPIFYQGG